MKNISLIKKYNIVMFTNKLRENWLTHAIFLLYVILLSIVMSKHEPWADEAQAWLLARDSSIFDLLIKNLRYEGHPPLWYLILMIPAKILPYYSISIISAIIAIIGVFLLLYRSSFPKIIRLLLPFTYFIFYQYAIIARSYVLIPILLFIIASLYEKKNDKIYLFTAFVCLLANVSVFSTLIALSIMFVHLIDIIKARSLLTREMIKKQIIAYVIFSLMIALIFLVLWQPEDGSFAKRYRYSIINFLKLSRDLLNESMTEKLYLSIPVLVISLVWLWQTRLLLLYLISTISVLGLFSIKYYNSWHLGFIYMIWVFVMWLSFDKQREWRFKNPKFSGIIKKISILSIIIVLGFNIYWSASASIHDYNGTYSAGGNIAIEFPEKS